MHVPKIPSLICLYRFYNMLAYRRISFAENVVLLQSKATNAVNRAYKVGEVFKKPNSRQQLYFCLNSLALSFRYAFIVTIKVFCYFVAAYTTLAQVADKQLVFVVVGKEDF